MNARDLIDAGARTLAGAGVTSARLDARLLLAYAMDASPDELPGTCTIAPAERERFEILLARRVAREPLAAITGSKEFWSLPFDVGPGVLIPRPETETLIDELKRAFPDPTSPLAILDLGTGTGCLLVAALSEYPDAAGEGVDRSPDALAWAARNVEKHGLARRCRLRRGDWGDGFLGPHDAILANPPYIRADEFPALAPEVVRYEPRLALDGGADGLEAYRALAPRIAESLKPEGRAFLEIGTGQAIAAKAILEAGGLEVLRIAGDLAGIERCMVARKARAVEL